MPAQFLDRSRLRSRETVILALPDPISVMSGGTYRYKYRYTVNVYYGLELTGTVNCKQGQPIKTINISIYKYNTRESYKKSEAS